MALLFDQRGEGEGEGQGEGAGEGEGQGGAPAEGGEGGTPGAGGEGTPEPDPIVTEFGEIPQDPKQFAEYLKNNVYSKYSKTKTDFDNLRNKSGLTEKNLALTRKALEGSGIRAVQDETGQIRLEVINTKPTERQRKFQDTHKSLFDKPVLEALEYFFEDKFEDLFETKTKTYREQMQQRRIQSQLFDEATDLMFSHFPQLDGKWGKDGKATNADFDQAFHDKVFEVWESEYNNDPRGQLLAALKVARELNIIPQAVKKAESAGFKKGQEAKKVLGPVGGTKAGTPKAGQLSEKEYFDLSPEARKEYDAKQLGLKTA